MNTRDRGICLYLSGRFADAIRELQHYLETFSAAVDRAAIEGAPPVQLASVFALWHSRVSARTGILEMCRTALVASTLDGEQQGEPPRDQQSDE